VDNPTGAGQVLCKLCDFGVCCITDAVSAQSQTRTIGQGTPAYLAPEATDGLHGKARYSSAVDVFAFGVVLWNMFYGEADPYRGRLFQGFGSCTAGRTERPEFVLPAGGDDGDGDGGGDGNGTEAGGSQGRFRIQRLAELAARCWAQQSEDRPSFVEIDTELAKWVESRVPFENC
jgi:serine/threonine protein kinase